MKEIYTIKEENKETQVTIQDMPLVAAEVFGTENNCSLELYFYANGKEKKLYIGTDETFSIYGALKDFFNK